MQSRVEDILQAMIDGTESSELPKPQSRNEDLLLQVLDKMNEGGGGAVIDDTTVSTTKTWSSSKIDSTKLDANQGGANSGKVMGVDATGDVVPVEVEGGNIAVTETPVSGEDYAIDIVEGEHGSVTSVAGKTGVVTLNGDDVSYSDLVDYGDGTVGGEIADLKSHLTATNNDIDNLKSFNSEVINQHGFFDTTKGGFYGNSGTHVENGAFSCSSIFELSIVPTYYSVFHSVVTWKDGVCNGQTLYANIENVPAFDRIAFNYTTAQKAAGAVVRYGAEYIDPHTVERNTEEIAELNSITEGLYDKIGVVENVSYSKDNPMSVIVGSYTGTGAINTALPNYYHSELMQVIPGTSISYTNMRAYGGWSLIAAFDINRVFLPDKTLLSDENTFKTGAWIVPDGVSYVSFSIYAPETTMWDILIPSYIWASELILGSTGPWQNKTAVIIGDSITAGLYTPVEGTDGVANPKFWETAKDILGISTFIGYGQTGTSISRTSSINPTGAMSIRYASMINGADLVIVAGGTNDYGTNVVLGTISDTTDISFYGALNVLCDGLQSKYPGKRIVFITPIHRRVETANVAGATLEQYRQAIYEVARDKYGFAVIDGKTMGISCANSAFENLYIHDGLHPTQIGHNLYGQCFAHALNAI